jgi:hypothetical protein
MAGLPATVLTVPTAGRAMKTTAIGEDMIVGQAMAPRPGTGHTEEIGHQAGIPPITAGKRCG